MVGRQRDVLLATQLHVPCPQPGLIARPRLGLAEGLARRLILVCAPAGPGKTALLADWVRGGDRPVAWLSLDAADNDPARFGGIWLRRWTGVPGDRGAGLAAGSAGTVLVRGAGDGADQQAGRPARRG